MKCGLLPICQEAMICGDVTYHDYQGIVIDPEEKDQIRNDLGQTSKVRQPDLNTNYICA